MKNRVLNDSFSVVPAGLTDITALRRVAEETWWRCYRDMISEAQIAYMLAWMYDPERLRAEMVEGVDWLLLKRAGSAGPVGFAAWGSTERDGEAQLHKLYVHPEHQGCGGGQRLLDAVYRRAAAVGHRWLSLTVNRHNEVALRCYERAGFRHAGSQVKAIGGGFVMDDFLLSRPLSPA